MVSTAKKRDRYWKTFTRSPFVQDRRLGARILLIASAPKPKPITTMPVARPFLSGNHLATVATGVT